MFRHRRPAAFAVMVVAASTVGSGSGPAAAGTDGSGSASERQAAGSTGEYVVVFDRGVDAGAAAVEAAGGTVVDVTEQVDMALVAAEDDSFLEDVQRAEAVRSATLNHSVGTMEPGMPHRFVDERPSEAERLAATREGRHRSPERATPQRPGAEPLADRQWGMEMIGATPDGAHRRATGRAVSVGIIDTGIDASHPDIAPNFDAERSRNFTMDIPEVDGPCEVPTCVDPPDVDHAGHGTHVAGIVGAARNDFGIGGVAPDATLVNLRAGQDSGYFFLYETVAALVEAGNLGLDVVNMSFYVDPWLYNCDSRDDYVEGDVTDEELADQASVRNLVSAGLEHAYQNGVTLIAAGGNQHTDLTAPQRTDSSSPDFPEGTARSRTVTSDCLSMPTEGPHVFSASAVGPSGRKSDYSNYGLGPIGIAAPGGWFQDFAGTPDFQVPENLVLSSYPLEAAKQEGLADENGQPTDTFSVRHCDTRGRCGFYTYLAGTSMASPHVAGVAALIVQRHGEPTADGRALDPEAVTNILATTATDHPCPEAGFEDYTATGRTPEWNAACQGTPEYNGLYGDGIVSAASAVQR